jgi:UDP:flavonoid glycosyltransferase YjiC (YdhE family)
MRVLVASVPIPGHFHPLAPLALALRDAGDEVLVASGQSVCERAGSMGLAAAPVGTEVEQWFETLRSRVRGIPGDGLPPERILGYFLPRLFGECGAPAMVDDLITLVADWRPDLLVYESTTFAAPLAAAVAGVPAVHHTITLLPPAEVWALCADAISPLWRSLGVTPASYAGLFDGQTLATWPSSLDTASGMESFAIDRLRPVPYDTAAGEGLPPWVASLPDRPTVYMTLGTVLNTDTSIFRAVLEGLADAPVNLIVTVGSANDPAALGDPPANAHVERYIPQSLLFPLCSVVISHAGSGTTLAALAHGLPQLLIPQGADQFVNADRCLEAGVGSRLLPDQVSPDAVRSSLNALLGDDGYRRAAARLQAEIERMPSPEEWIGPLHSLTEAVAR